MDNTPAPIPFGKYELLERVAIGGMAEVFRARTVGAAGFEKYLAIKRILPHLSSDTDFVVMLIDEAKIAVNLNHANVVQVYDLGKVDGTYFIAMEFIEGGDLRSVLHRSLQRGRPIPIALAIYLVMEVLKGLEYAHQKKVVSKDAAVDLRIIHRDVSPPNILISYEGEVKIVDFGIAKANTRMMETSAGVVKGKFEYMSPEQASGLELDSRTDLFSVAVCLYEAITGKNPFSATSDLQVLQKVRAAKVPPPSQLNPDVPARLDGVLARALAREVEDRYQRASDLRADLASVAYEEGLMATSSRLAAFMRELFAKEMAEGRLFVRVPEEDTGKGGRNIAPPIARASGLGLDRQSHRPGSLLTGEVEDGPRTVVQPNPLLELDEEPDTHLFKRGQAAGAEAPTLPGGKEPAPLRAPQRPISAAGSGHEAGRPPAAEAQTQRPSGPQRPPDGGARAQAVQPPSVPRAPLPPVPTEMILSRGDLPLRPPDPPRQPAQAPRPPAAAQAPQNRPAAPVRPPGAAPAPEPRRAPEPQRPAEPQRREPGRSPEPPLREAARPTFEDPGSDLSADATFLARPAPRKAAAEAPPPARVNLPPAAEPRTEPGLRRADEPMMATQPAAVISLEPAPLGPALRAGFDPQATSEDVEILQGPFAGGEPPILSTGTDVVVPPLPLPNLSDSSPNMGPPPMPLPTWPQPPPPVRVAQSVLESSSTPVAPLPPQAPAPLAPAPAAPARRGVTFVGFLSGIAVGALFTWIIASSLAPHEDVTKPPAPRATEVTVTLQTSEGATAWINGQAAATTFPFKATLATGRPHQIKVEKAGFEPVERELVLESDVVLVIEFAAPAAPASPAANP